MENICEKMPPIIPISHFNNNWEKYLKYLYNIYLDTFFNNSVIYKNVKIKTFTELNYQGMQQSFEHITTKGSRDRLYNEERCARIMWIKPIIEGLCDNCSNIAIWKEKKKNKINIIIWCKSTDFVVVLEQRKNEYYLITAYKVIYGNKRIDLEKNYKKYIQKTKNAYH